MKVDLLDEAEAELNALPPREVDAMRNALRKLEAVGERLGYPHSSAVKGAAEPLRELRPRGGRSRFRAFYRAEADVATVAAIGPEAQHDPRGFKRAVDLALARLAAEEAEGDG